MTDSLGWRMKFGVVAPSTNTSVQPEYDDMRPRGVTNHFSRIVIPDMRVTNDEEFVAMVQSIRDATEAAIDAVMTCSPQHVIMGMSAETFWDGQGRSDDLLARMEKRAGVGVTMGSHACLHAIRQYGNVKRIAVITPYMPVGDAQVHKFFTDNGFDVVTVKGLKCPSPMLIAHVQPDELRRAVLEVNDPSVELIIQAGTNLAFGAVAAEAERWLDKPVLAINTCTYWHALRRHGIEDRIEGYGSLLTEH
jgi:maleate isomerase